jgi:hypothetical protein
MSRLARLVLAFGLTISLASVVAQEAPAGAQTRSASGAAQSAIRVPARVGPAKSIPTGADYRSVFSHKDLSPVPSGTVTAATTRCPAFVTWEDWGGSRVHAYVDFHPSDWCNGRHVKRAYVRLIRQCGPYYDTGRIYTYTATSTSDTRLYSVSAWIWDSPLWGCNTNTYYNYDYF